MFHSFSILFVFNHNTFIWWLSLLNCTTVYVLYYYSVLNNAVISKKLIEVLHSGITENALVSKKSIVNALLWSHSRYLKYWNWPAFDWYDNYRQLSSARITKMVMGGRKSQWVGRNFVLIWAHVLQIVGYICYATVLL